MAAQPEEVAQAGALKHPKAGDKCLTASEMERNQRGAELPCLSDRAPWKECFYEKVQQRSLSLQEAKVKMVCAQKAKEEKAKKREPSDGLCQEWFGKEKESLDARTYLADKLLPTLIPGVEKLLMEVERKDVLTSATEHATFDPITFLGEYLMRHNPQYDTCTKPGPYLRGLNAVTEELKRGIPDTASQRLARMKSEVKTKRKEREQADRMKRQQKEMRKAALATQFKEWTADVSGRIPVALIQSAMKIFLDVCASTPIDARKACKRKLEIADTWGENVNADEFIEYVHSYTENFPNDAFQEVLKHLSQCAADFQESIRRDTCKQMFIDLFLHCDRGQVGVLDRAQILGLLEQFYERSSACARRRFCNPKKWPVVELQEVSLEDLWGDIEDQEDYEEPREGLVLSQPEISEREVLAREPAGDNRQGSDGTSTIVRGLLEQMDVSETETGGIPEEENQAAESGGAEDAMAAEAVEEPPARKEGFTRQHSHWSEQQTSSGTALQDEDRLQEPGEGPALSDGPGSAAAGSQERKEPWPGDLLTFDLSFRHGSCGEKIPEDWGCEKRFPDLHPTMADIQSCSAPRFGSPFDGSCLNLPRFVQLMETFLGEGVALPAVKGLIGFIKEEYKQTEEEKVKQLEKAHLISRLTRRELLLEALFEKWDINASGFLEMKEVEAAMNAFKEGMEKEAVRKAKKHFCSRYPQLGRVGKLSPKAFQAFLELVASELTGGEDEVIDNIVEFLTTRVERSHMQCLQSLARRRWLHNIQQAAETSGARMDPVYDAVLKALLKDAEAHGDNKKISAYIALLEENQLSPERGQTLLRYVTCTTDDAPYVLNQTLYRDMKGVSFAAVEEKKPIHVPRVQLHGNIHFWNQDRPAEQRRGSFLVLPLQDAHWRVFGTLGLDTLRDQSEKTIFLTHEISFYQGVSHAFSKAYQHVCALGSVLQMALTALDWLYHRVPSIHTVSTYLVEPGNDQTRDYALRRMITTDSTGQKEIHTSPVLLLRKENLFRDYLFKCIDCSEVVCRSVCGEQHIAVPLRDLSGRALGLFDISIRPHQTLPPHEHKDLQRMLKMAQAACSEILKIPSEEAKASRVLEAEHGNVRHAGILFHRFMLQDLRECIQKLNAESFAEIKSYEDPPALVHNIMKAVLLLLHPEWEGTEKTENWNQCILQLDDNLIEEMYCFDPTAASVHVQAELVHDCINGTSWNMEAHNLHPVPRAMFRERRSARRVRLREGSRKQQKKEESAVAEQQAAVPSGGRDKMAALSKQYGLIMPKKLQQKNLASNKLSVFADDSDDEPSVGESLQKEALKKQAMKQTKLEIQKALSEDATVYEYDSIYDEMQQKKKESSARLLSGRDEKKPRYIHNILKAAEIRKKEQEKRMERKIQKEREMEGGEFADKEAFVTSAYKKKLQERAEEEERERREAALEAYLDVTKQKDLSGFYRHLLNQRVGEEEVPKCSFREARIKEDKSDSCYDESSQRSKGPYERQRLKPSAKEEDNPDADTDLESDSNDEKRHKSVKVSLKKKKKRDSSESSEEETKRHKSQRHSRSPSSSSAEEELRTKDQTNHLTKKGEGRKGYDEQYREKDYQRSRTHEKDHQREKEERHRYGDHTGKDYYRRREEQDDKQREKERKEREGHGREWRKAKEREEKCSEKEREKERIRSGKDRSSDREKERGEKCREKEDHSKERREKGSSDEKYRDRRESSPAALEKDDTDLEKERKGREKEVDEKKSYSSGNLSGQKRKDGEGEKEEKEETQKPPESMSKFAKRSNEETVMSARDRYLARQMARVGAKSYIEKEED